MRDLTGIRQLPRHPQLVNQFKNLRWGVQNQNSSSFQCPYNLILVNYKIYQQYIFIKLISNKFSPSEFS